MNTKKAVGLVISVEAVRYFWREWYVRAIEDTGRVPHWGPWLSRAAAYYLVGILIRKFRQAGRMKDG